VLRQDYEDFEVRVLDDGSTQHDLCERLSVAFQDERLHCHRSEEALGVPGGRNALVQHAQGDVVCFIDDDAWFADEHGLSNAAATFRRYPQAGVLAFKVTDLLPSGTRRATPFHAQTTLRRWPELADRPNRVSHFIGRGHAIRRDVFLQCGGFDETLHYGGEERDLSYRVIEAGHTVRYVPSVHVLHRPAASPLDTEEGGKVYYLIRNRLRLAYRHLPGRYLPVHVAAWVARYGWVAARRRQLDDFARGVRDGLRATRRTRRTPVSPSTVRYLEANYGQLWY
jgi:GT2 family glycosyltransferase